MHIVPVVVLAVACTAIPMSAIAQGAPLKAGLWQLHTEGNGKSTSDMSERLKNVPPEARKQVEAMMKERGVDISGGDPKVCLDQKTIEQGNWQQNAAHSSCKVDYSSRTSSRWAWKAVCAEPASTTEGEMLFSGNESYRITSTTTMLVDGKPSVTKVAMSSKWLGANCGDVKPASNR